MIQTMFYVTDTMVCEAMTIVRVVKKRVCISQTISSIPGTKVFLKEKPFPTAGSIFLVARTMV